MTPTANAPYLSNALAQILGQASTTKGLAEQSIAAIQAGPINTSGLFALLDQFNRAIQRFEYQATPAGLDAYAVEQVPGYTGALTVDVAATVAAIRYCNDWIVATLPKDESGTWLLAQQIAPDGTRTDRSFDAGGEQTELQTRLQALLATIG